MTRGRWLVVVLALIPAAFATVGVVVYSRGVDEQPLPAGPMVPVVVSKVDIPPGTDLNELIKDDQFRIILIPEDAVVVDRPVTSLDQLRDGHYDLAILAGEQIRAGPMKGPKRDGSGIRSSRLG